jgi:hypothetical protein
LTAPVYAVGFPFSKYGTPVGAVFTLLGAVVLMLGVDIFLTPPIGLTIVEEPIFVDAPVMFPVVQALGSAMVDVETLPVACWPPIFGAHHCFFNKSCCFLMKSLDIPNESAIKACISCMM